MALATQPGPLVAFGVGYPSACMEPQEALGGQLLPLSGPRPTTAAKGRKCTQEGCLTVLSRYNLGLYCSTCLNPRKAKRALMRPDEG